MSKAGRLGLVALAVVVVVVAFLIARPGDDDDGGGSSVSNTPAETTEASPTATAPSAPTPPADGPDATVIELTDHAPPSVESIEVKKGDPVRIVVRSDVADDIHIHGYDLERAAAPGKPARFAFPADLEGIFEIESHEAEHAGKDALIARLVVEPS
jgi:FtsP/CotA-like multicopper oxidase with cupredoxin domain